MQSRDKHQLLLSQLNDAISHTNAENAFVTLCVMNIDRALANHSETGSGSPRQAALELAAFHLYPHFGTITETDASAVASISCLIDALSKQLFLQGEALSEECGHDPAVGEIVSHVRSYLEMVRGTRYITQIKDQLSHLHGPFEARYQKAVGLGPNRAVSILDAIQEQLSINYHEACESATTVFSTYRERFSKTPRPPITQTSQGAESIDFIAFVACMSEIVANRFPVSREQLTSLPNPPTDQEWTALVCLLGLTIDGRGTATESIQLKQRPLFSLPDRRLLFVDLSSVLDALCSAYDQVARSDEAFLSGRFQQNQKTWMETRVIDCLRRVFPSESVFAGLNYPNPDQPGQTAEMDAAVSWGPFVLLIEAKAKQLRLYEGLTNPRKLRDDLKRNVQDALEQADRTMRFIHSAPSVGFDELHTERKLRVSTSSLRRVFKMSITLHHLADFATQLAILKPLNLFTNGDYPLSLSLEDLDIITRFCEGPEVFLHYVERRLQLQQTQRDIRADELDLFGTYLDIRLHPSLLWERKSQDDKQPTLIWITGGCERFDAWHDAELGLTADKPEIRLNLPPRVSALLTSLRNSHDDGSRWLAFALLNLSPNGMNRLDQLLSELQGQHIEPTKMRRATFLDGSIVGVIIASRMLDSHRLREILQARMLVEKYKHKAEFVFGFAIDLNDVSKSFDSVAWYEEKWHHDPEIEAILRRPTGED